MSLVTDAERREAFVNAGPEREQMKQLLLDLPKAIPDGWEPIIIDGIAVTKLGHPEADLRAIRIGRYAGWCWACRQECKDPAGETFVCGKCQTYNPMVWLTRVAYFAPDFVYHAGFREWLWGYLNHGGSVEFSTGTGRYPLDGPRQERVWGAPYVLNHDGQLTRRTMQRG